MKEEIRGARQSPVVDYSVVVVVVVVVSNAHNNNCLAPKTS
jgi:hypothetical protein